MPASSKSRNKSPQEGRPQNADKRVAAHERLRAMLKSAEAGVFSGEISVKLTCRKGRFEALESKMTRIE